MIKISGNTEDNFFFAIVTLKDSIRSQKTKKKRKRDREKKTYFF